MISESKYSHLSSVFVFLQQPSLCCHSKNVWQCAFQVLKEAVGGGLHPSPFQQKQMHNSCCHPKVFSETSREHVGTGAGPGNLPAVTVCSVKEQSINLQRNVKRTGFSCLCVGREPSACCHLMVELVYTCSDQLST